MQLVAGWLSNPDPARFPYDVVVDEYHRVGKHFVSPDVLGMLNGARDIARDLSSETARLLQRFLDVALDKWDRRYSYPTYLALDLLPLPCFEDWRDVGSAAQTRARLTTLLLSDALRFEDLAVSGQSELLPEMRPDGRTVAKRYLLGLRVVIPMLSRAGVHVRLPMTDPVAATRRLCAAVESVISPTERHSLQVSMLPVYIIHDEYLFIRVLQSFETTFALLAVQLRAAVSAILRADETAASLLLSSAADELHEAAPLFSLLGTMQVEAFQTFRRYTEGASAIQSTNYKLVESLCRHPHGERLESAAYGSVPDVRRRVLEGQPDIDQAVRDACASGVLDENARNRLAPAMDRFASTLAHWRQTHYRLAARMLGDRPGTGYTQGTPYLKQVRDLPVFDSTQTSPSIHAVTAR